MKEKKSRIIIGDPIIRHVGIDKDVVWYFQQISPMTTLFYYLQSWKLCAQQPNWLMSHSYLTASPWALAALIMTRSKPRCYNKVCAMILYICVFNTSNKNYFYKNLGSYMNSWINLQWHNLFRALPAIKKHI